MYQLINTVLRRFNQDIKRKFDTFATDLHGTKNDGRKVVDLQFHEIGENTH